YSLLLEGARRVGKSTVAEEFARNEYASHIIIDFDNVSSAVIDCFDDIYDLDMFFLRLQAATDKTLVPGDSVIVFDEIQLFPKARQAMKYLVKDGRYHYMATGSLISIKKNVKDILIPSEEIKVRVHPMDFEEFCWATDSNMYNLVSQMFDTGKEVGQAVNRKWSRDFRLYMAVGGMPQAVQAFLAGKSFQEIDDVKRIIIDLYMDDFKKIDSTGKISALYRSIPAQLAKDTKRYLISEATRRRKRSSDEELLFDLIDSRTVLASYNTTDPSVSLSSTKSLDSYKLYVADTGLFITLMFLERPKLLNEVYTKLLSDKLPANLGYLYENIVAQIIASTDLELYYHTWKKADSTHYYEIDFLIPSGTKIHAVEVKSSGVGKHESLKRFIAKYPRVVSKAFLLSQK
ncbi:MAG: AAA family ATPase, partial [Gallicola sp.]|nr:AAA family ATPase [Gallicola sp.]